MSVAVLGKTRCAICGTVLASGDELVSLVGGEVLPAASALRPFTDAPIHRGCLARWQHLREYAQAYNAYAQAQLRGMRHMREDGTIEDREPHGGSAA